MAEEVIESATEASADDFAARAIASMKTDSDKPADSTPAKVDKPQEAAKTEKAASKLDHLDQIFTSKEDTKKPDEKKDEAPVSELAQIAKPEFKNPKASEQWDKLHEKASSFEKRATEFQKKYTELEQKIADYESKLKNTESLNAQLEKLKKEHEESMSLVRQVNIDLDPEYRKTYIEGRKNLIEQAKSIVDESGGNPSDVEVALNLTGKARVEALSAVADSMSTFQQGRLGSLISELTKLDKEAQEKRSNPETYLAQREQQMQAENVRRREESAKHLNLAYEDAFTQASKDIELFRKIEGNQEWNAQADEIANKAKSNWLQNNDMTTAARKHIEAEAMPVFRSLFLEQRNENKSLRKELDDAKAELAKVYNTTPAMRTKSSTAASGGRDLEFHERVTNSMNEK